MFVGFAKFKYIYHIFSNRRAPGAKAWVAGGAFTFPSKCIEFWNKHNEETT